MLCDGETYMLTGFQQLEIRRIEDIASLLGQACGLHDRSAIVFVRFELLRKEGLVERRGCERSHRGF